MSFIRSGLMFVLFLDLLKQWSGRGLKFCSLNWELDEDKDINRNNVSSSEIMFSVHYHKKTYNLNYTLTGKKNELILVNCLVFYQHAVSTLGSGLKPRFTQITFI